MTMKWKMRDWCREEGWWSLEGSWEVQDAEDVPSLDEHEKDGQGEQDEDRRMGDEDGRDEVHEDDEVLLRVGRFGVVAVGGEVVAVVAS